MNPTLIENVGPNETRIPVSDVKLFLSGDLLELPSGELVEVVSPPYPAGSVIDVRRGVSGTIRAPVSASSPVKIVLRNRCLL